MRFVALLVTASALVFSLACDPVDPGTAGGGAAGGGSASGGGAVGGGGGAAGGGSAGGGLSEGGGSASDGGGSSGGGSAGGGSAGGGTVDAGTDAGTPDAGPGGPNVDRTNPRLIEVRFKATAADADAGTQAPGNQQVFLDTRAVPRGQLVVYLHGAENIGATGNCGSAEHGRLLASWGFHVFMPCYASAYGIGICGNDFAACRLEAFDGTNRTAAINVARPDSIEGRLVRGLQRLATTNPEGDWGWYLVNGQPRWSHIIVSGISHGASTTGVISKTKVLAGAVMLSGPLDTNQAWLTLPTMTPLAKVYAFTHTADDQHPGHLQSFTAMALTGAPANVDTGTPPYGGSHRFVTSAPTGDGHGSTQAGGSSPKTDAGTYRFVPVWKTAYGVP